MKTLLLIRHAKSSWDTPMQKDFDRPLNDRGHHDAPVMAKRMLDKHIKIDTFISSPAKRALTTAKYFAETYDQKEKQIIKIAALYEASYKTFYDVIAEVEDVYKCIAVFSHNPGITAFANDLTKVQVDDMPTCSIFTVQADIKSWKLFKEANKTFLFFDYPKLKE